jgi:hypothetical protein
MMDPKLEPMPQPRADRLVEALFPPPLAVRALSTGLAVAALLAFGFALGAWWTVARFDPPIRVLHVEPGHVTSWMEL